jgi:hypothetical protein
MRLATVLALIAVVANMLVMTTAATAQSSDCTDYLAYPHLQGRLRLTDPITSLVPGVHHAYAATEAGEIAVVSTFDPDAMGVVATIPIGGSSTTVEHLVRRGEVLFAAISGTGGGVVALDITDPSEPVYLATLPITGGARLLEAHGDLLLVQRAQGDTLDVVWAASPAFMSLWSSVALDALVLLSGHLEDGGPDSELFYARTRTDLDVWDLADPAQPVLRGRLDRGDATPARSMALTTDRIHLILPGAWTNDAEVVDVGLPDDPSEVGRIPTRYTTAAVDVAGDLAYITLVNGAVDIFQLEDLTHPVHLNSLPGPANVATVLEGGGLFCAAGPVLSSYTTLGADQAYPPVGFHDHGWGFTYDAHRHGDHVYVSGDVGLQVLDVSDPAAPIQTFVAHPPAGAALHGEHLYVGDTDGLTVYGLLDPASPMPLAYLSLPDWPAGPELEAAEGVLVVGLRDSLVTFDITDPVVPQRLGSRLIEAQTFEVATGRVFVLSSDRLHVLDLATPSTLPMLGQLSLSAGGEDLAVDGSYAYICNANVGNGVIEVVDVRDPAAPALFHTMEDIGARGVSLHGNRLLCSQGGWGVQILDVSEPTAPVYAGHLYFGYEVGWAYRARALGDLTWIGHDVGSSFLPTPCTETVVVAVHDEGIGEGSGGQPMADVSAAHALPVHAYPNPFNPSVTVRFHLPEAVAAGDVDVAVFDTRGRLVRQLIRGRALGAGAHDLAWDGLDQTGRAVASGSYLARVRVSGFQGAVRLMLVR